MKHITEKYPLLVPLVLVALFFGPMFLAWFLYSGHISWQEKTVNHGKLLNPMPNLSQLLLNDSSQQKFNSQDLSGRWLMVFISQKPCTLACQDNLYKMRQVRLALGKDMNRVQRVIITYPNEPTPTLDQLLKTGYNGTEHFYIKRNDLAQFISKNHLDNIAPHQGALYFVDPEGNIMLSYDAKANAENILSDLKRLLATSQMG